jgi:hypothetical protein
VLMGSSPLLFGLWLSLFALVFVCLMQSLRYMLCMKKCSMTFSLEMKVDFICNEGLYDSWIIFFICSGFVYQLI